MKFLKFAALLSVFLFSGCMRPFEPIKLEEIQPHEAAFLVPYVGGVEKQVSINNEDVLRQNLVNVRQVRIPQQWVQLGREWFFYNGEWRDAAKLIRVNLEPETREWTADPGTGTSDKDEAIWVMTADQVEWSTGWTCTAQIEDPVKFLAQYPNGVLKSKMDAEIRGKIQSVFGLAVTDLPMESLMTGSTPIINQTIKEVTEFFSARGIKITNLGITGGYVYKNKAIADKMAEVFRSKQEHSIATAKGKAQEEENKRIKLQAEGESEAIMIKAKAEAEAITIKSKAEADRTKLAAEAKKYEIEQAANNPDSYALLKRLELEKAKMERWDGKFPSYYMGTTGVDMLLNVPLVK